MPPSGPMMIRLCPTPAAIWASGCVASSCSTSAPVDFGDHGHQLQVEHRSVDLGHPQPPGLLGGLADGGAPLLQGLLATLPRPAHDRARRLPRHDLVDAHLGQHLHGQLGPITLGQRLHGEIPVGRPGLDRCSRTSTTRPVLSRRHHLAAYPAPRPSPIMISSPGPIRRTTAACRPSAPPSVTLNRQRAAVPEGVGAGTAGRSPVRRTRPAAGRTRHAPCFCTLTSGAGLLAELGELPQQLALLVVDPGRGLDQQGHAELAAAAGPQPGHALAVDRDPGAGLGAGRARRRGPMGLRRRRPPGRPPGSPPCTSVPSAAAVIGMRHDDLEVVAVAAERPRAARPAARRTGRRPARRRSRPRRARPGGSGCRC